jgi:hypothetical protein
VAGSDYANCDACETGKVFYDANVDWENFGPRIGSIRIICSECYQKGQRLKFKDSVNWDAKNNWGIHCWTNEGDEIIKNQTVTPPREDET